MMKTAQLSSLAALTALALLVSLASPQRASAPDKAAPMTAAQVTDRVQGFYESIQDFQSRFEQVYTDVAADETKSFGGKVFFKKPGKMRWDYLKTEGDKVTAQKVLVSNGAEFTIYEAEFDQYFRQCLKESQLPTALRFLMGTGDLKAEFNISLAKKAAEGTYVLDLIPKKSAGQYKKLSFVVDAQSFAVRETIVYDPYGITNPVIFQTPRLNKSLPDAGFDFSPPPGTRSLGGADVKCN